MARRNHLGAYSKLHDYVFAATKNGLVLCKLDGHTRSYLWSRGELAAPAGGVQVLLIEVSGMAEAKRLYDQLDNPVAVKKPRDVIFGATRENHFQLRSGLLQPCRFGVQLRMVTGGDATPQDRAKFVKLWKPELIMLDSFGLSSKYSTLIGVMLLTVAMDGGTIPGDFWKAVDSDSGTKDSRGMMDGIEAIVRHIEIRRAETKMTGFDNLDDMSRRGLCAYLAWKDGRKVRALSHAKDYDDILEAVRTKKSKEESHARS
jgi:hypothetical protein